jgi:hypothetical protein
LTNSELTPAAKIKPSGSKAATGRPERFIRPWQWFDLEEKSELKGEFMFQSTEIKYQFRQVIIYQNTIGPVSCVMYRISTKIRLKIFLYNQFDLLAENSIHDLSVKLPTQIFMHLDFYFPPL